MAARGRNAVLAASLLITSACGGSGLAPGPTRLAAIGAGLSGPAGLQATVYAQGLPRASAFAADVQGRLWVATADSPDRGHDGLYLIARPGASPVEVVASLHTPLGLLWYQQSLYVSSAGRVDAYSNFDGARFGARRTVLALAGGIGEFNAIVLAPDGRMLMGISAPCDHCTPTSTWSASIVSFRPDGSDLRTVATGIRAAVGLAYDPGTSELLVAMNQRDDLGAQTPGDWLAVVRPGQAWGFPGCYGQGGSACAGVPRPTAVLDKHAAVSDVVIVTGQLGPTVGTSALVAEWTLGKVQRVALNKAGRTSMGQVAPFLAGVKNPVALLLSSDGALFVGDWTTGTVYRIAPRSG